MKINREELKKLNVPGNIGKRMRWGGREWTIEGVNYLGDYDLVMYEDRPDGRYKIGGSCTLGLPKGHPHYAEIIEGMHYERPVESAGNLWWHWNEGHWELHHVDFNENGDPFDGAYGYKLREGVYAPCLPPEPPSVQESK